MPQRIPGKLDLAPVYNDPWRGWPVKPLHRQHPIRGSFLDPRPDPVLGAIYHDGIDVAVRDDRPERGAPAGRTHRVHAIEGGPVFLATPRGARALRESVTSGTGTSIRRADRRDRRARPAHRLDVQRRLARPPQRVRLHERAAARREPTSPGREGAAVRGRRAAGIARFASSPASRLDRRASTSVARLEQAGSVLPRPTLGRVDVRVRVSDPQSFIGGSWSAVARGPAPSVSPRGADRRSRDEQDGSSPRGVPGGAGARPPAGSTSLRAQSSTFRREGACGGTRRFAATACTGFASFPVSGTRPDSGRPLRIRVRAWTCAATSRMRVPSSRSRTASRRRERGRASAPLREAAVAGSSLPCGSTSCDPLERSSRRERAQLPEEAADWFSWPVTISSASLHQTCVAPGARDLLEPVWGLRSRYARGMLAGVPPTSNRASACRASPAAELSEVRVPAQEVGDGVEGDRAGEKARMTTDEEKRLLPPCCLRPVDATRIDAEPRAGGAEQRRHAREVVDLTPQPTSGAGAAFPSRRDRSRRSRPAPAARATGPR